MSERPVCSACGRRVVRASHACNTREGETPPKPVETRELDLLFITSRSSSARVLTMAGQQRVADTCFELGLIPARPKVVERV